MFLSSGKVVKHFQYFRSEGRQRWRCLRERSDRQPSIQKLKCVCVSEATSFTESALLVKQLKEMLSGPESSHTQLLPNNQPVWVSPHMCRIMYLCLWCVCMLPVQYVCLCLVCACRLICQISWHCLTPYAAAPCLSGRSPNPLRILLPKELLVCVRLRSQSGSVAEPSGTPRGQSGGQKEKERQLLCCSDAQERNGQWSESVAEQHCWS